MQNEVNSQKSILIIDFGSQYTQLIARRIREMGVYCEIYPYDYDEVTLKSIDVYGYILSGGPSTVIHQNTPKAPDWIFSSNVPVLGICYGMQTMAAQLGGEVQPAAIREFGYAELRLHGHSTLLEHIEDNTTSDGTALLHVWMSHGDKVTQLPPGFKVICETNHASIAGMADEQRRLYGLQFHPEVTHTTQGQRILERFVLELCAAEATWTPDEIVQLTIDKVREQVGDQQVLLGLSGGVDSSVVAALLHQAIGDQLICVFVDTGLLRLDEAEQVLTMFETHMGIQIHFVQAEAIFYKALKGITCPEEKRKVIGHTFINIFEQEAKRFDKAHWLAQGTIYPDVIESSAIKAPGGSEVIKSHHNVGGLPETMNLQLLEPIRTLFKDEVRKIGLELGLPYDMVYRHPFPGPGLGVRILGEVKKEYADILRKADAIFIDELKHADLYHQVNQAFAVFLPVRSVGVMGDGRRYDFVVCLRAVETVDFMTAKWAHLPFAFLEKVSNRIINEVQGISRVVYDISGKPPATIEWE